MSDSPIERWCEWLATLPPDVADDLARMINAMLPGAPPVPEGRPGLALIAHLRGLSAATKREAGLALCLAAITDVIAAAQADPATWAETRAMLEVLDQAAGEVLGDDVGEFVERAKLRTPLIARQWMAAAASWEEVRKEGLAPSTIVRWLRRRRINPLKPI